MTGKYAIKYFKNLLLTYTKKPYLKHLNKNKISPILKILKLWMLTRICVMRKTVSSIFYGEGEVGGKKEKSYHGYY